MDTKSWILNGTLRKIKLVYENLLLNHNKTEKSIPDDFQPKYKRGKINLLKNIREHLHDLEVSKDSLNSTQKN